MRKLLTVCALIVSYFLINESCKQYSSINYFSEYCGSIVVSLFVTWQVHYYIREIICKLWLSKVSPNGKSVFITGCDSGFGHAAAKRFASKRFHVFAGCLVILIIESLSIRSKLMKVTFDTHSNSIRANQARNHLNNSVDELLSFLWK